MSFKVTEDTIIGDIMDADESTAEYFLEMGMHCLYCPSSRGESVKQACEVHGVNPEDLIAKLNAHFAD
jgi:hybrid cluster-associated redox disulfide protein